MLGIDWPHFTWYISNIIPNLESVLYLHIYLISVPSIGVGSTLGVGIYVIIGTVAAKQSGPSVVLSFIIGAVSSIFAGLCYAGIIIIVYNHDNN